MKIENIAFGSFILFFAAVLFGDAVLSTFNPSGMILSPNDVKGITGFIFIVIAIFIFLKGRK